MEPDQYYRTHPQISLYTPTPPLSSVSPRTREMDSISHFPSLLLPANCPFFLFFSAANRISNQIFSRNKHKKRNRNLPSHFLALSQLNQNSMNSRELALVSTATVFGALASAFAVRFYSSNSNSRKQFSKINSVPDGDVSKKCSSQSPFDPSKRKELLTFQLYVFSAFIC